MNLSLSFRFVARIFPFIVLILFCPALTFIAEAQTDSAEVIHITQIIITGNQKTEPRIILRELDFAASDSVDISGLEKKIIRSKENLMNTGLFNFADIHYYLGNYHEATIHIELIERWYLWPLPIFEIADRNFNEWWLTKDLNRTNYGINLTQENFRGMDETIRALVQFGYTQRLGLSYAIPYINRKQNIGLQLGLSGSRNHETVYDLINNKLIFYKNPDAYVRKDFGVYARITRRKGLYEYFNTTIEYRNTSVADTIPVLNEHFFVRSLTNQQHIGINWSYRYDHRDYQPYALKGGLIELEAFKTGIGILTNEPDLLGIALGFRKYYNITQRLNISGAVKGRLMQQDAGPFFNQRALGYGTDYIRTYDYYVINGQNFTLFKSNFKYNLLPTKVYQLPYIKSDKFRRVPVAIYANAFFDAGYVQDNYYAARNPLANSIQYGYGAGIDYVTYYDLVFRFEYGWNRMHESGFFFRIGAAF